MSKLTIVKNGQKLEILIKENRKENRNILQEFINNDSIFIYEDRYMRINKGISN